MSEKERDDREQTKEQTSDTYEADSSGANAESQSAGQLEETETVGAKEEAVPAVSDTEPGANKVNTTTDSTQYPSTPAIEGNQVDEVGKQPPKPASRANEADFPMEDEESQPAGRP